MAATAYAATTLQIRNPADLDKYLTFQLISSAISTTAVDKDVMTREIEKLFAGRVALLSENKPESGILSPISADLQGWPVPSKFYADELLDWEATIEVAPTRPSGTLTVILEYAGRATPSPTRDPWD